MNMINEVFFALYFVKIVINLLYYKVNSMNKRKKEKKNDDTCKQVNLQSLQ